MRCHIETHYAGDGYRLWLLADRPARGLYVPGRELAADRTARRVTLTSYLDR